MYVVQNKAYTIYIIISHGKKRSLLREKVAKGPPLGENSTKNAPHMEGPLDYL